MSVKIFHDSPSRSNTMNAAELKCINWIEKNFNSFFFFSFFVGLRDAIRSWALVYVRLGMWHIRSIELKNFKQFFFCIKYARAVKQVTPNVCYASDRANDCSHTTVNQIIRHTIFDLGFFWNWIDFPSVYNVYPSIHCNTKLEISYCKSNQSTHTEWERDTSGKKRIAVLFLRNAIAYVSCIKVENAEKHVSVTATNCYFYLLLLNRYLVLANASTPNTPLLKMCNWLSVSF